MARIPPPKPLAPVVRPESTVPVTRPVSELPPDTGYLKGEIERLPSGEVTSVAEFPMLRNGRGERGKVSDLLKLVREETNDAAGNAAKLAAEAVGGGGRKTFERSVARAAPVTPTSGDLLLAVRDGKAVRVDVGDISGGGGGGPVDWDDVQDKPTVFPPDTHTHAQSDITNLTTDLAAKAPLASPALTGNPTAPTQSAGNNSTRIATTAYTDTAIAALIASAPGVLDTLDEIAAALGDDPNFAASMTTALAGKLAKSANLSDVANAATARTNLGVAIGTDVVAQSHVGTGGAAHANVIAGGNAGFMTGADKTKLDGIASGATANTGTVTSASVVTANGFAGSVATATTTPAITVSTTITGLLKGNGTAVSAASAGSDYQAPITLTTTGSSGPATLISNTLNIPQYSGGAAADANRNILINSTFRTDQRNNGVATTTADNAYWADRWRYIGEASASLRANDATITGGKIGADVRFTGTTDKGGIFQVVEGLHCKHLRGGAVTLSAQIGVNNARLSDMRMAILEWTGTEDATTGDPVSAWNAAGTNPTLAANWAFLNTPANLTAPVGSGSRFSVNGTVGGSANNLAVLIWNDDKTYNANDEFYVFEAQLEAGASPTAYERMNITTEQAQCQRYFYKWGYENSDTGTGIRLFGYGGAGVFEGATYRHPVTMRSIPTAAINGTWAKTNAGNPSLSDVSTRSFNFFFQVTALGAFDVYPDSTDDFITMSAEI